MKTLILVRHAKSSWDYEDLPDFKRPSTSEAKRRTPNGQATPGKENPPRISWCPAPAVRALTTCELMAEVLGYPLNKIRKTEALYHASEERILEVSTTCQISMTRKK